MQQTIKHICIFLLFLVVVFLWDGAKQYIERMLPRFYRDSITLFLWSTMIVVFWHLLYNYLGRVADKVVYVITAVVVIGMLIYYGVINVL